MLLLGLFLCSHQVVDTVALGTVLCIMRYQHVPWVPGVKDKLTPVVCHHHLSQLTGHGTVWRLVLCVPGKSAADKPTYVCCRPRKQHACLAVANSFGV